MTKETVYLVIADFGSGPEVWRTHVFDSADAAKVEFNFFYSNAKLLKVVKLNLNFTTHVSVDLTQDS